MKGFSRAVDALAILDREFPMLTLAIAGDGPLKDDLKRQVPVVGAGRPGISLGVAWRRQPCLRCGGCLSPLVRFR